jgi:hypothetical protein
MIPHVGAVVGGEVRLFHVDPRGKHRRGGDVAAGTKGEGVKIAKQELVRMLRTEGDIDTAEKAESRLPDEIDTDADADDLESIGLDRTQLQAKLAGGALGGTLAP